MDIRTAPLNVRLIAGSIAGVIGAAAFVVEQEIDLRVLDHDADDLTLIGGMLSDDRTTARRIGLAGHLVFGAVFGAGHAAVLDPVLPGGPVQRGFTTAMLENFAFYPLTRPFERFHPYIRDGRMDDYWHPRALVQATLRHAVLGIAMGAAYPRLVRSMT